MVAGREPRPGLRDDMKSALRGRRVSPTVTRCARILVCLGEGVREEWGLERPPHPCAWPLQRVASLGRIQAECSA